MTSRWIFGSFKRDFSFLTLPGLLVLLFAFLVSPANGLGEELLALFALVICDSGHVYTTLWRTYANAKERKSSPLYFVVPVLVLLAVSFWIYWGLPWFWTFIIWVTVYHNYRQFYGIARWEQKLNQDKRKMNLVFLAVLCWLPFLIFHLRGTGVHFYSENAIVKLPWTWLLPYGQALYFAILFVWLGLTFKQLIQKTIVWPVTLAVLTPVLFYGISFLLGVRLSQVLFALVVSHGVGYMALMSLSLKKVEVPYKASFRVWFWIMIATAIIFGFIEAQFEEFYLLDLATYESYPQNILLSVLGGLYLVPLLSHYIFDGWLWTSRHRDAKLIYK